MKLKNVCKAVGAIVIKDNLFLLVHKIKMMNSLKGPEKIKPRWDFPKGGVKDTDINLEHAIIRELKEETGSMQYKIIKRFREKIIFEFPKDIQDKIGFKNQEVTMFLIEFFGDKDSLRSQNEEIDGIKFVSRKEIKDIIVFKDFKDFFKRNV